MRAADALQKIHAQQPCLLEPHQRTRNFLPKQTNKEVVELSTQVLPHLPLTKSQVKQLSVCGNPRWKRLKQLSAYRRPSNSARNCRALAGISKSNRWSHHLCPRPWHPAMQARARHLLIKPFRRSQYLSKVKTTAFLWAGSFYTETQVP